MKQRVRVGLVGSQFISSIHADALKRCSQAEIVAVASPTPGNAAAFAAKHGIPRAFTDYRELLEMQEIDLVVVGAPNDLHCRITVDAAAAGKHVVMEKPLCLNLAEADRMIEACRAGRGQADVRRGALLRSQVRAARSSSSIAGALGTPTLVKQCGKARRPHAAHFWDVERAGGGVTMDMGCHAIEFFRWMLGRPRIAVGLRPDEHAGARRQDARRRQRHHPGGVRGTGSSASPRRAGPSKAAWTTAPRSHGSNGVAYRRPAAWQRHRDLQRHRLRLRRGEGRLAPGAGASRSTRRRGTTAFTQEMAHFVDCVQNDTTPLVTGEDGRAVLEAIFAAYESARTGRKVELPFKTAAAKPFDLWKPGTTA